MIGGENRRRSILKALRKQRIDQDIYGYLNREHGYYDNLHQYSKNKIHCSCPLCAAKSTKYRGRGPLINYKISDIRKLQKMKESEKEDLVP
jgi:hypothetical protein